MKFTMANFSRFLLPGVAFLVGGLAGYLVGYQSPPSAISEGASTGNQTQAGRVEGTTESQTNAPGWWQNVTAGGKSPQLKAITAPELAMELEDAFSTGFGGSQMITKWAQLVERLKVSDVSTLARELSQNPSSSTRESGLGLVMTAFAERDPTGAWSFASSLPMGPARQGALSAVISAVSAKDADRALSMIDSLGDVSAQRQLRSVAMMNLAGRDPESALRLALDSSKTQEGDFSISMIFSQWARKDIDAAKAALSRLSGRQLDMATTALVTSIAQRDPREAWEFASSLSQTGEAYRDPRRNVIQVWSQSDPAAALQAAMQIPEGPSRNQSISTAVSSWAQNDFSAALQHTLSIPDSTMRSEILRVMSSGRVQEPEKMFQAVIEHMPAGDNFQQSISSVLSSWASENPVAAAAALDQLPPGRIHTQAASQVANQWASLGRHEEALRWTKTLSSSEARQASVSQLFSSWAGKDPEAAKRALAGLSGPERSSAVGSLAGAWARSDPEAVLRWSGTISEPDDKRNVVRQAVSQWADFSPASAAGYSMQLPEAERGGAVQSVVERWSSKDAEAAASWLSQQPAGEWRDGSALVLSRKIAQEDPEVALSWASTVSNERNRDRQIERIARDWIRQDASAAKAWVGGAAISDELKQKLLQSQ